MNVIAIYQTDPWHGRSSMELIAIATTENQRDILVRRYLKNYLYRKPDMKTIEMAIKEVQEIGQTQCLSEQCDMEIYTESYDINTILQ